jgi:hypothetical protein
MFIVGTGVTTRRMGRVSSLLTMVTETDSLERSITITRRKENMNLVMVMFTRASMKMISSMDTVRGLHILDECVLLIYIVLFPLHVHVGVMVYSNGDRYEGEFARNMKNGSGIFQFANGSVYDGEYEDDQMHGCGKYKSHLGGAWEWSRHCTALHYTGVFNMDINTT